MPSENIKLALIGVIGTALGAGITNVDKIVDTVAKMTNSKLGVSAKAEDWTGVFREYSDSIQKETVSTEFVSITRTSDDITGLAKTNNRAVKKWDIAGKFKNDLTIIYYIGAKKSGMAAFSYVLQGNPEMGKLKGYWTGYDPEQKKIVSCPYILTKESDIDKIKKDEAKFLDVQCL